MSMGLEIGKSSRNRNFSIYLNQSRFNHQRNSKPTNMDTTESNAAKAVMRWVGSGTFREPWLKYNPTINVDNISELNMSHACWDIVVREIRSANPERLSAEIVFQFASRRAPHDLLRVDLAFDLCEGPENCIWKGIIEEVWVAPRDPTYWYSD